MLAARRFKLQRPFVRLRSSRLHGSLRRLVNTCLHCARSLAHNHCAIHAVAITLEGLIVSGLSNNTAKVWTREGKYVRTLKGHSDDIYAVAEAMQTALNMPYDERLERRNRMMDRMRREDVAAWRNDFISRLESVTPATAGGG